MEKNRQLRMVTGSARSLLMATLFFFAYAGGASGFGKKSQSVDTAATQQTETKSTDTAATSDGNSASTATDSANDSGTATDAGATADSGATATSSAAATASHANSSSTHTIAFTSTVSTTATTTATSSPIDQHSAQMQAANTDSLGSSLAATVAVVSCAEGANVIGQSDSTAGVLIQACLHNFATARQLNALQAKAAGNVGLTNDSVPLKANEAALNSGRSTSILGDLEEKYGVKRDEFTHRLLRANGDPETMGKQEFLDGLLNGQISQKQVMKALSSAESLSEEENREALAGSRVGGLAEELLYAIGRPGKDATMHSTSQGAGSSLRNALSRRTAGVSEDSVDTQDDVPMKSFKLDSVNSGLTPSEDPLFTRAVRSTAEAYAGVPEADLSLFDRVRLRYREKAQEMGLGSVPNSL